MNQYLEYDQHDFENFDSLEQAIKEKWKTDTGNDWVEESSGKSIWIAKRIYRPLRPNPGDNRDFFTVKILEVDESSHQNFMSKSADYFFQKAKIYFAQVSAKPDGKGGEKWIFYQLIDPNIPPPTPPKNNINFL